MSSNLPPGVTDSMIPGNRPEDIAFEKVIDWISGLPLSASQVRDAIRDHLDRHNIAYDAAQVPKLLDDLPPDMEEGGEG